MTFDTGFGILGNLASLVSLVFAVWAFYTHINKALLKLLDRHVSCLDRHQALDLANFYLEAVQSELRHLSVNFLGNDLGRVIASKNTDHAKAFFYNETDKVILAHRSKLSRFRFVGPTSFDQFLNRISPINDGTIKNAKDRVFQVFEEAIDGSFSSEVAAARANLIMGEAQNIAGNDIRTAIQHLYQSAGDVT